MTFWLEISDRTSTEPTSKNAIVLLSCAEPLCDEADTCWVVQLVCTTLELRGALFFNDQCWLRLNDQPKATTKSTKKPAAAPFGSKSTKAKKNPLFEAAPKNFGIGTLRSFSLCYTFLSLCPGQHIQPQTDLSRFVKWPEYVRLQRQKTILNQRLKVPPSIAQFSHTLDKNTATQLFKLLNKYRPESKVEKKTRLEATASAAADGKDKDVRSFFN